MRALYLSIIFTVLGSLFFIGWGLDKLAEYAEQTQESIQDSSSALVSIYRQVINGFVEELNLATEADLPAKLTQLTQQYQVSATIVLAENVALPESLAKELKLKGGLLLASDQRQYLLEEISAYPKYLVQLNLPAEPEHNSPVNFILTLALYLGICIILILWLFPLTRRLYLLNSAAAKIGAGQLDARINPSRFSYIKMLEKSFNNMAAQIEKLVADNKILARSLSHDIRTPMACLRFGLEAAIDTPKLEKKNHYLNRMDHELTRMEDMTSAFLDYASMERQALHLKKQSVVLEELLQSVISDCQPLTQDDITLDLVSLVPDNLTCSLDYHWCYRALTNLVSNAISYARSQVLITLYIRQKKIIITIEDDGKGIAPDKLDIIFTPFVKLDAERPREHGHFGLGLAICAKVMHWHQGTIKASASKQFSGACFTLTLPNK